MNHRGPPTATTMAIPPARKNTPMTAAGPIAPGAASWDAANAPPRVPSACASHGNRKLAAGSCGMDRRISSIDDISSPAGTGINLGPSSTSRLFRMAPSTRPVTVARIFRWRGFKGRRLSIRVRVQMSFSRFTISMAASAASFPLLPALPPARSSACSSDSQVRTPKATGMPPSRLAFRIPEAV